MQKRWAAGGSGSWPDDRRGNGGACQWAHEHTGASEAFLTDSMVKAEQLSLNGWQLVACSHKPHDMFRDSVATVSTVEPPVFMMCTNDNGAACCVGD